MAAGAVSLWDSWLVGVEMSNQKDRWLVTGASGQLGKELVRHLAHLGFPVSALSHADLNVADEKSIEVALDQEKPKYVINAAAYTNVDAAETDAEAAWATNADGPRRLAEAIARRPDVFLAHISTDYVFGLSGGEPRSWHECDLVAPLNEYGRTKAAGEKAVREALPNRSLIVRTAWLYAPGFNNFVSTMVGRAVAGTPSRVVADQWGQPTWARDVANHVVSLVSRLSDGRAPSGTYHATNSGRATWFTLASRIYERAGAAVDLVTPIASTEISRVATRPPWSVLGHEAWSLAGMPPPRPWERALDDALPIFLNRHASS